MAKDIKQQQWRSLSEQEWRERLSDEATECCGSTVPNGRLAAST